MALVKIAVWLVAYPIMFVGFMGVTALEIVTFLFNSPVDVWNIISTSFEQPVEEE